MSRFEHMSSRGAVPEQIERAVNTIADYVSVNVRTVVAAHAIDPSTDRIVLVDSTSGVIAVTLPSAVGLAGEWFLVKRIAGGNTVNVTPQAGEQIDSGGAGVAHALSSSMAFVRVVSDGAAWWIVAHKA